MDRRAFLQMLGLGTVGAAFNPAITSRIWELPKHLVVTDGPVTHEWIAAEALKVLCENFEFPERSKLSKVTIPLDALEILAVNIWRGDPDREMLLSRTEYRTRYIDPSMLQLASALTDKKPKIFLPQETHQNAHLLTHYESGLNLRWTSAYDLFSQPPGVVAKFDVMFAA